MATLLDLVWDLVERPAERADYDRDPAGYVRARGRADLTAEDVHEALDVVCDLVPADLAAAVAGGRSAGPSPTLGGDEAPFDRALETLSHLVKTLDGQPEAGPRPDPKDTSIDPTELGAEPTAEPEAEAADDASPSAEAPPPTSPGQSIFDPAALEIEQDRLRPPEVREPVAVPTEEPPFDPTAILAVDDESELADVVPLSWDDDPADGSATAAVGAPEVDRPVDELISADEPAIDPPAPEPVPEGGFGTGGRITLSWDEGARPGDEDDAAEDAPTPERTNLFSKKSKLTLPTLGIDASNLYDDEDEPG